MSRTDDWFRQAEKDLLHAEESTKLTHFEWSCLAALQSAEKAVKSIFIELGADPWGHSLLGLLNKLPKGHKPDNETL